MRRAAATTTTAAAVVAAATIRTTVVAAATHGGAGARTGDGHRTGARAETLSRAAFEARVTSSVLHRTINGVAIQQTPLTVRLLERITHITRTAGVSQVHARETQHKNLQTHRRVAEDKRVDRARHVQHLVLVTFDLPLDARRPVLDRRKRSRFVEKRADGRRIRLLCSDSGKPSAVVTARRRRRGRN